ncbi:MAG TPA: type I restriction enzyme HsdR N-terminal domain-containing protein [Bacteroidales bacterium]|nr:type I restriction enzyme HsdR N-terminal domain-containing protein [Bacteroidales bacterium]
MQKLNLPPYEFRVRSEGGKTMIFDPYRKKYLQLTPEEDVRQHFAMYLTKEKGYPVSLMMTEHALKLNEQTRRSDIVIFNRKGEPAGLVECKAPHIKISQKVFDQVSRYNLIFRVKYLFVTNGLAHYCCKVDFEKAEIAFLTAIPHYNELG